MQRPFARPHNNQGDEYEQPHDTYADEDIPDACCRRWRLHRSGGSSGGGDVSSFAKEISWLVEERRVHCILIWLEEEIPRLHLHLATVLQEEVAFTHGVLLRCERRNTIVGMISYFALRSGLDVGDFRLTRLLPGTSHTTLDRQRQTPPAQLRHIVSLQHTPLPVLSLLTT